MHLVYTLTCKYIRPSLAHSLISSIFQFFKGPKTKGQRASRVVQTPINPQLHAKIQEIETLTEAQVNDRLQAMLVGPLSLIQCSIHYKTPLARKKQRRVAECNDNDFDKLLQPFVVACFCGCSSNRNICKRFPSRENIAIHGLCPSLSQWVPYSMLFCLSRAHRRT